MCYFYKKKIKLLLEQLKFKNINITTNIFLAPFFAYFGWKVSDFIQKIEDKYFNHPFRFLLFVVCEIVLFVGFRGHWGLGSGKDFFLWILCFYAWIRLTR